METSGSQQNTSGLFTLEIKLRNDQSCRGSVQYGGEGAGFGSALELLKFIDSAVAARQAAGR